MLNYKSLVKCLVPSIFVPETWVLSTPKFRVEMMKDQLMETRSMNSGSRSRHLTLITMEESIPTPLRMYFITYISRKSYYEPTRLREGSKWHNDSVERDPNRKVSRSLVWCVWETRSTSFSNQNRLLSYYKRQNNDQVLPQVVKLKKSDFIM